MADQECGADRWAAHRLAEDQARLKARADATTHRKQLYVQALEKRYRENELRRELKKRRCGAKTRAGHPCKRKGSGRGGRCPNHGGMSTGPRTEAGRQRVAEAQRQRWATWRATRNKTCRTQPKPHFVRSDPSGMIPPGVGAQARWVGEGRCRRCVLRPSVRRGAKPVAE